MTGNVYFTQYLRPNGRKKLLTIELPAPVVTKADFILSHGFKFEAEVLIPGQISFTVSDEDGDYFFKICDNGPGVKAAVEYLIMSFDVPTALEQRRQNRDSEPNLLHLDSWESILPDSMPLRR